MSIAELNRMDRARFVHALAGVFENSPWIPEACWERRPFADRGALLAAFVAVLDDASADRKVALIAAHPDLAGRLAREGRLSAPSRDEQSAAGLDALTAAQRSRFEARNAAYRARFGFPFVICAREHDAASILDAMERRAANDRATEVAEALTEIGKIAALRLTDVVNA